MTREEARRKAEVMMAYADGKEIEFFDDYIDDWDKEDNPIFNWGINDYRIKKEPTYRPFANKEECWAEMQKHQPFGWVSYDNEFIDILSIDALGVNFMYKGILDSLIYSSALARLCFIDGTPFGIKEG